MASFAQSVSNTLVSGDMAALEGDVIGTHSGTFHCDEALACAMLKMLPQFAASPVLRSRTPEQLSRCHIVVDVGGVYDIESRRFDHHQRSFSETLSPSHKTKLSSAGLVYKHYGRDVLRRIAAGLAVELDDTLVEVVYDKVYKGFVEHVDGIDNGIEAFDGQRNYAVTSTISSRVGHLNPSWNESAPPGDSAVEDSQMERFRRAMLLTLDEFTGVVARLLTSWIPARAIVESALAERATVHPSGKVIRLGQFCPWKDHLFDLEREGAAPEGDVLYVLYEDSSGKWRVQAVPETPGSFTSRRALGPPTLRGLRDEELSTAANIEGCIFIHASGFIGGNKSYDGALAMAALSMTGDD